LLSSESVTADLDNYRKLTREHSEIIPIVELYRAYQRCEQDINTAREMYADLDMRSFAETEIQSGKEKLVKIEAEIQKQLLPKDPNDERNIFLEIRRDGGDECIVCRQLVSCIHAMKKDAVGRLIISQSLSDIVALRKLSQSIGQGAYSRLKFEWSSRSTCASYWKRRTGAYFNLHCSGHA
jgi:peptide chain release factor 1